MTTCLVIHLYIKQLTKCLSVAFVRIRVVGRWISLCETQHATDSDCWATITELGEDRWKRIDCTNSFDRLENQVTNTRCPTNPLRPFTEMYSQQRTIRTIWTRDIDDHQHIRLKRVASPPGGTTAQPADGAFDPTHSHSPPSLAQVCHPTHCKAFNGSYNQQPPRLRGFCG